MVGSLVLSLLSCAPMGFTRDLALDAAVTRLALDLDVAAVTVGTSEVPWIVISGQGGEPDLSLSLESVDDTALVVVRCPACDLRVEAGLPREMPVDLTLGEGAATFDGRGGRLALDLGTGDITGQGLLTTSILACTDQGTITLESLLSPELIVVDAVSGDISLVVPSDTYALDLQAKNVEVNGVETDPTSPRIIEGRAPAGRVQVMGIQLE